MTGENIQAGLFINGVRLSNKRSADDTVTLTHSIQDLQELMTAT